MKDKIIEYSDRMGFLFLCLVAFFLGFSKAGINICVGFALLAFIIKKVTGCGLRIRNYPLSTRLNLPILCFFLVSMISIVESPELAKSFWALFFKTGRYLILYFLAVDMINTKKRLWAILIILLASAALLGVDGIWQHFNPKGIDFLRERSLIYGQRVTASFDHSNNFGAYLALVLPLVLALGISREVKFPSLNIVIGLLTILLLVCLGLTYSRGAWVGFLVGLFFIIIYQLVKLPTHQSKIILALIALLFLVGITVILPGTMKERLMSIGEIHDAARFHLWKEAIDFIEEKPIFGHGLGVYMDKSRGFYAHNCYLQMAAEIGIVGLICFVWILVELFGGGIRILREKKDMVLLGFLSGISAFLIHSFFDTNLYSLQLSVLIWFAIGLAVSTQRLAGRQIEQVG